MVTAIICSSIIGAIVGGILVGLCKGDEDFSVTMWEIERTKRQEAECALIKAEEELRRGCRNFRGYSFSYRCGNCYPCYQCNIHNCHLHDWQCKEPRIIEKVVYAKTPQEQETVDLLTKVKITPELDQLKKKFGIIS